MSPDDLMDLGDLADWFGVARSTMRVMLADPGRHRRVDGFPAPLRRVGGSPVWVRSDVEDWGRTGTGIVRRPSVTNYRGT